MPFLNRIATATPPNDVHVAFVEFAETLLDSPRARALFRRMSERSQIAHRWSVLAPSPDPGAGSAVDDQGFYARGAFPSTGSRMVRYQAEAPGLAETAVRRLSEETDVVSATHLIVTTCTGFSAPGIDLELVRRCGLDPAIERTMIGFTGCHAAVNGLRLARHIVRSDPAARVLLVSLELCTLHLQEAGDLEQMLTFLVFGDGCAAALVTAEPEGLALERFASLLAPDTAGHITWAIGEQGFDMHLSGQVPATVGAVLRSHSAAILGAARVEDVDLWAVHPGGRTVLDAVEQGLELPAGALGPSREVLRRYGNMSSPTILFVLDALMRGKPDKGRQGRAMAFGPGLTAETMAFEVAS